MINTLESMDSKLHHLLHWLYWWCEGYLCPCLESALWIFIASF